MLDSTDTEHSPKAIQEAAESGDSAAQCELGMMYEHGLGMPKDYQAAILWYRSAAEGGNGYAQFKLAGLYEVGSGVDQHFEKSLAWLRKAAENGLTEAQYRLGLFLETGKGCEPKPSDAAAWYISAANQGSADAQFRLGLLYEKGSGVARDMEAASNYYALAAANGNANAQYNLGVMYVTGDGVKKDLEQAKQLFEAAAAHGHRHAGSKWEEAAQLAANKPKNSLEVKAPENTPKPAEEESEDNAFLKEMFRITLRALIPIGPAGVIAALLKWTPFGEMLSNFANEYRAAVFAIAGIFFVSAVAMVVSFFKIKTKPDWFKLGCFGICAACCIGFFWAGLNPYMKAADPRIALSGPEETGVRRYRGVGTVSGGKFYSSSQPVKAPSLVGPQVVDTNDSVAVEQHNSNLLKKAQTGDTKSKVNLAVNYEIGLGLDQSAERAVEWYTEAAKSQNRFAQCRLGMMYMNGLGVQQDPAQAVKWLQKSANQNFAPADYQLGLMYEFGHGVHQSFDDAVKWYRKGAKLNEAHNQYRLALLALDGKSKQAEPGVAALLLQNAASKQLPEAAAKLSELYQKGITVPVNQSDAAKWQDQAQKFAGKKASPAVPGSDEWLYRQADQLVEQTKPGSKSGGKQ